MLVTELIDPALPRSLPFRIYLPPCYGQPEIRDYPVLYLLHGQTYRDDQWVNLGAPVAVTIKSSFSTGLPV